MIKVRNKLAFPSIVTTCLRPILTTSALVFAASLFTGCAATPQLCSSDRDFHISTTPYPQVRGGKLPGWWAERLEEKCKIAEAGGVDVLFVGDSITNFWEKEGDFGKTVWARDMVPLKAANFGYGNDETQNVLWRFDHGELSGKLSPKVVIVMIGTNNTGHRMEAPAEIALGVRAVVGRLTTHFPKAHILLLDIFPRGATSADLKRKNNEAVNAELAKLDGASGGHVHFFPIGSKFLRQDGTLSRDIMPDWLHPNTKGYEIWSAAILPEIKKWLRD